MEYHEAEKKRSRQVLGLHRSFIGELFEVIEVECRQNLLKSIMFMRQAAQQRNENEAVGPFTQPMGHLREILKYV